MVDAQPKTDELDALRSEVRESRSRIKNGLLIALGSVSAVLGIVGIILPVVPTTPFLLLAAACYARSSERFYLALLTNRYFGRYIRDWREDRGLTLPTKLWVIIFLAATMSFSAYFVPRVEVKVMLAIIGLGVSAYILHLPTKSADATDDH